MLKLSFRQQVFAGFAASVVLVLIVGILAYSSIGRLENDSAMVDHSQKVMKTSTDLLQQLVDAETGVRGYIATADTVFLDPYKPAVQFIRMDIEQLHDLVADNPDQAKRADSLATLANSQLSILRNNIAERRTAGLDYMVQNHALLNGKLNMDRIRGLVVEINVADSKTLNAHKEASRSAASEALDIILIGSVVFLVIIIVLFFYIQETFEQQKATEATLKKTNAELEKVLSENRAQNWLLTGVGELNEKMQGEQAEAELADNILTEVCGYTGALTGTFYLFNQDTEEFRLFASYAVNNPDLLAKTTRFSEGWIGQAAKNGKMAIIKGRLNDQIKLKSSLIHENLIESYIVPFFFEKALKGILEIAYDSAPDNAVKEYLSNVADDIGIIINTAQARTLLHDLLAQVQQQAEELASQQEEMRMTNEELLAKTEMLQTSEEELTVQQEELRSTNAELEEKAGLLEEKNQALEEARKAIAVKMRELETTGKYKSEFMANMSHELRTPLNSILVLARILQDNKPGNLSADQLKYANVIFNAGNDLLALINDILDLAKIESGKIELKNEKVQVSEILHNMEMLFGEVARNKKIKYNLRTESNAPATLVTDQGKVEQILKNLLSNAFKFTPEKGIVTIVVTSGSRPGTIDFTIRDTGIGIPLDKQKLIFEAFQQADGSTSRRYGGTGLGLSISRELVSLLGGKITVKSEPEQGSEFTLTLGLSPKITDEQAPRPDVMIAEEALAPAAELKRASSREPMVVIVEDDKNFAEILKDYARDYGYSAVIVNEGTRAVEIIKEKQPDAVILDIMLPGKDGWQILKELKQDSETFQIPVHLMSAGDVAEKTATKEGAISFLKKPVDKAVLEKLFGDMIRQGGNFFKRVLLIEDNEAQSMALLELMRNNGITIDHAHDGSTALEMLDGHEYQCIILDLNLPDIPGLDLLDKIKSVEKFSTLPVVINTAMELDKNSVNRLMKYANAMVLKANKSADRLIDEVNLFLHKIGEPGIASPQPEKPVLPAAGRQALKGKKILVVDDDMRNVFALTSALEGYDMIVEVAGDGSEALDKLDTNADIDLVLMDIMMPVMDGYEAMRAIRAQARFARLPVIALTAKAMKDDREKCIAAGANDYVTKPVDMDQLLNLMQLWLIQ